MNCPFCGHKGSKVIDSRSIGDGIRRRRQCINCGSRFTTSERIQSKSFFVIKKDNRREEFNREKLLSGIRKSCEKRPLPIGTIDKIVEDIETVLYNSGKTEISSSDIGDKVIEKIEKLDYIAYIRYASVYRDFADISTLKQAVDTLIETGTKPPPSGQLFLLAPEKLTISRQQQRRHK